MKQTPHQLAIAHLGVDLGKQAFHACGMTRAGKIVLERRFTRAQLERFAEELPPCRVGLEACGGAHHWARLFRRQGHDARLMAPSFVKPFVKSSKNDARDAEAIREARSRPSKRSSNAIGRGSGWCGTAPGWSISCEDFCRSAGS